jgi:hypothetical protein
VNPNYVELNLEAQKAAGKSHYKVYKQLIELRKTPTIQRGGVHVAALSQNVLGFTRYAPLDHLYCQDNGEMTMLLEERREGKHK